MKVDKICLLLVCSLLISCSIVAKERSFDSLKPQWIHKTPQPTNSTYSFKVVYTDIASELEGARVASVKELTKTVERDENVKVTEVYDYMSKQKTNNGVDVSGQDDEQYIMQINIDGKPVPLNYLKVDEYWEDVYENGRKFFKLYTLYAVANKGKSPKFDDFFLTNKYGAQGLVRSLIPGWGQLYKGSTTKGFCIIGGEVACIAGIVVCENLRASYVKKMREQPKFASTYNSKADNWETGRNLCIGAAAALYVYNLVDAIAAKGAKRVIVKPRQRINFSLAPTVLHDGCGIAFVCNF